MRRAFVVLFLCSALAGGLYWLMYESETPVQAAEKPRKASGIEKRVLWTTSNVKGSPEPPSPYLFENAFPKLKFSEPLELAQVPNSKRMVVAQQRGQIFTFVNDRETSEKHLLIDLKRGVYGVAMHPKFADNGYFYVANITDPNEKADGSRISRFKVKKVDPPEADMSSETVILTWPSGGHNGGCLRFGPDGYLYLVTGDGSGIADQLETGQKLDDLLASILRIDVDKTEEGRNYAIPKDNPFIAMKDARQEVYAYGLRQLWKFSFDRASGELWGGEVGQDLWEMVYKIEKGGNYGWSVQEGAHPFRPLRKLGPTPILPPIVEHNHAEFRSITGGYVYQGSRLPELKGAYIYGDYDTGRVWMLRYDGKTKKVAEHRELTDSQLRIVAFGEDAAGEVYALDHMGGGIHRLVKAPPPAANAPKFPRKLSETGIFASTKDNKPAAGVIPYSVNSELWSDGAIKERFIAIPGDGKIEYNTMTYPLPAPGSQPGWRFPDGTVLVKTFALETEVGNAKSRKRLETRLLVGERVLGNEDVGDQVWTGYTYVWNDAQTDAELLDSKGLDRIIQIKDAKGVREQTYHFPSRAECTMCHTVTAKYALGVNTLQMNRDHDYGDSVANQLATFEHIGLFTKPLPEKPEKLPKIVDFHDKSQSLDARTRAYLHANCSHCHRKWGGGNAEFQLLATLPLNELGIANVPPAHGDLGIKGAKLLAPGDAERSLIAHRMAQLGLGRMPHIASKVVDAEGVALIREWIKSLPKQ